ncbi:hypothetical protein NB639_01250 [Oxalobacter formigenes]|uniref:hypothetical protein n=1 Tax=Oxalobacter formigenes TaxID=847 RepID=UPI0022AE7D2A|nr:hypothetical protein [Oxalobacter formigenes]WAW06058.1 hypothetical protein NB639_01250 [Oxalobacter formigenes]
MCVLKSPTPMIIKKILLTISVLFCTTAYADNWDVQIAESNTHTYVISSPIKIEYIKKNGLWVKQKPKKKRGYAMVLYNANCENATLGISSLTEYSANGASKTLLDSRYPHYQRVIPDSIGENIFNFICSVNDFY